MPLLGRRQPDPYGHSRRGRWTAALAGLIALLAAGVIGWSIGQSGEGKTRTVTHTVTVAQPSPAVYQHTPQAAVAAVQAFLYQRAVTPATGPLAASNPRPGQVHGDWALLYRVKSYSPQDATVSTWGLELGYGYGAASLGWGFTDVEVHWDGRQWAPTANPLTIVPDGATPPPNDTSGAADSAFGQLLYPFRRFPGEP